MLPTLILKFFREQGDYFVTPEDMGEPVIRTIPSGSGQAYEAAKKLFMSAVSMARKSLSLIRLSVLCSR